MNKAIMSVVTTISFITGMVNLSLTVHAEYDAPQLEYLDRGTVAVKNGNSVFLSWRLLGTESYDTAFDVYRGSEKIATVSDSTNYTDMTIGRSYTVVPAGQAASSGKTVSVLQDQYIKMPLDVPKSSTSLDDGSVYTYSPNDVIPADVDGDGEYELILKWEPSNSFDSGKDARHSGNVYIDCYKLDGRKLWRIDLGVNINAGAHFTQIAAYDLDLDGRAELAMKTAPGSIDGQGSYVSEASLVNEIKAADNSADYRHSESGENDTGGRVLSGPEFYTVFEGDTGKALDTIYYPHPRGTVSEWGDSWGNRSERYLTAVAYLDGHTPSVIAWRGYYAKTTATAYDLVNKRLVQIADFDTSIYEYSEFGGNGNHNITVGDVDNDGCDEIICGSLALDNDLTLLWCSGRGHGDASHLADYDPTHSGMEYFSVHEDYDTSHFITGSTTGNKGKYIDGGMTLYDAATGKELFHKSARYDVGRGMMANVGYTDGYFEFWGCGNYSSYGDGNIKQGGYTPYSTNQRIFWDGDMYDELLDGSGSRNSGSSVVIADNNGRIAAFNNIRTINGTKNNACLIADIFGDWREEIVARSGDNKSLLVYTTTMPTEQKLYTLMHDRAYRMQVAAQNAGYNQPPHISYYVNDDNNIYDTRKYAAYVSTEHNGIREIRTDNLPEEKPSITPPPIGEQTAPPTATPTAAPEFQIIDGKVFAYNGTGGAVTIPESYNGYNVTLLTRSVFTGRDDITEIILPDTISDIEEGAFAGCTALQRIVVNNSQLNLDNSGISSNGKLTIYAPSGSQVEAFAKAKGIAFVSTTAEETTPEPASTPEPPKSEFVVDGGVLTEYNGNDRNIVVPESVNGEQINTLGQAFRENENIKSIVLPSTVTKLIDSALLGCVSLTDINLDNVTSIGSNAFYGCEGLKELTLGTRISVGRNAFFGCDKLHKIMIYDKSAYLENAGLTDNHRLSIYGYTGSVPEFFALYNAIPFYDIETNELITREFIVQPEEEVLLKYKGAGKEVEIPSEVDGIPVRAIGDAFAGTDIVSVELPESVNSVYYYAFSDCTSLKKVTLSGSMTELVNIFEGCTGLRKVYIPSGITNIEKDIFKDCPDVTIYGESGSAAEAYAVENNIPFTAGTIPDDLIKPDGYAYPYRVTGGSFSGGKITLNAECYEQKADACMIYAEYNDNGVLTGVKLRKLTAESGEMFNESFDVPGSRFKALIWDANSMQPYSEVYLMIVDNIVTNIVRAVD